MMVMIMVVFLGAIHRVVVRRFGVEGGVSDHRIVRMIPRRMCPGMDRLSLRLRVRAFTEAVGCHCFCIYQCHDVDF